MKAITITLAFLVSPLAGSEAEISLVPETKLGRRKFASFNEIGWKTDSPWFHKPAPVCRVVPKPLDLEPFRKIAEEFKIPASDHYRSTDPDAGLATDGTVYFADGPGTYRYAMANPRSRVFKVGLARFDKFERDELKMAVVKPLPTKEDCVRIGREWLSRMGIPETELYRQGDWPEGFKVSARANRVTRTHPVTKKKTAAEYGLVVHFVQEIGGLPAFWNGFGGSVVFQIADGGEFCSVQGCLRAWEKIGDFPVLNREEITTALNEGFYWSYGPIDCERLEVVKVELEAYHATTLQQQKDFPLLYTLTCKLHGGRDDGLTRSLLMPALKQHRDKYPVPEKKEPAKPSDKEAI